MGRKPRVQQGNRGKVSASAARVSGGPAGRNVASAFGVVGVGASAGGLEPLRTLCQDLPADAALALVVVVHFDAAGHSALADILATHANMPVRTVREPITLAPGNIYVIAPGFDLELQAGRLVPAPQTPNVHGRAIDRFLQSLAGAMGERAAAVILSGAGTDGSQGVRAVKEVGGLTIAQAPDEAQHAGMPESAIETGAVDLVLPASRIGPALLGHRLQSPPLAEAEDAAPSNGVGAAIPDVVALLRQATGHDFSAYEPATLARRIAHRMALHRSDSAAAYVGRLRSQPEELEALHKDLLIDVTGFFRDPEVIAGIERELAATAAELHSMIHGLEASNEELKLLNMQLEERVEAQRKSAADLANLMASTDIATLFLDREMRIRFFTPAVRRLFHVIGSDIGRPLSDFVSQIEDPALLDDAAKVLDTLVPLQVELETGHGAAWYSRRIAPYSTEGDRIDGVVVSYVDVSAIKRSEREARAAQTFAESIVATVRDPLLVLDTDLKVIMVSRAFCLAFGVQAGQVEGRPVAAILSEGLDLTPLADVLRDAVPHRREGEVREMEGREVELDVPDLGRRIFAVNVRQIEHNVPNRRLVLLSMEDVTERRRTTEQFHQDFLNATPDAIVVVDAQGAIRSANRMLETLFGYRRAEIIGMPIGMLIPEHDRAAAGFFDRLHVPTNGESTSLELVGRRKDGHEIPLQVSLAALRGPDGPLAIAAIRNPTAQKAAERALQAAKAEAERANDLKSDFLEATGRNLVRPLQTMGLLAGILERTVDPRDAQDTVARLDLLIESMTNSLNLLLDVNRIETGKIIPQVASYPIHDTIERMRTEFAHVAATRRLDLRVVSSTALVRSDRQIVDRILQNFVSNALRYNHAGRVLVGCRRAGRNLRIEVWDTGPGIPEDEMGRIFGEYERLTSPATGQEEGLGLGLYVAKRLADLLGHRIEVRSIAGKGSMFALEVPLELRPAAAGVHAPTATTARSGPAGVLVVSSNATTRGFLDVLLRLEGYDVRGVAGAQEAQTLVAATGFTVAGVIVDENPTDPYAAGSLVRMLRRQHTSRLVAIVLTSNPSMEYARELSGDGALALVKPFKANDLAAHVARLLAEAGHAPVRPAKEPPAAARHAPVEDDRPLVAVAVRDEALGQSIATILSDAGRRVEIHRTGQALLDSLATARPSCVVLGALVPGPPIVEVMAQLKNRGDGELPVILLASPGALEDAVTGMRAGAIDVLEPTSDPGALLAAVERGLAQRLQAAEHARAVEEARERLQRLTAREREIATLLTAGFSNKEIAAQLGLSQRTVENHRAQIRSKARIRSLAELVRLMDLIRQSRS